MEARPVRRTIAEARFPPLDNDGMVRRLNDALCVRHRLEPVDIRLGLQEMAETVLAPERGHLEVVTSNSHIGVTSEGTIALRNFVDEALPILSDSQRALDQRAWTRVGLRVAAGFCDQDFQEIAGWYRFIRPQSFGYGGTSVGETATVLLAGTTMMRLDEGWLVLRSAFTPDPEGGSAVVADLDAYHDDATDGPRPDLTWLHRAVDGIEDAVSAFFTPAGQEVLAIRSTDAADAWPVRPRE